MSIFTPIVLLIVVIETLLLIILFRDKIKEKKTKSDLNAVIDRLDNHVIKNIRNVMNSMNLLETKMNSTLRKIDSSISNIVQLDNNNRKNRINTATDAGFIKKRK